MALTQPSRTGDVSYALVPATGSGQYALKRGESAYGAQLISQDPPVYPPALITANLPPTTVRVKAIVDGNGRVTEVRDMDSVTSPNHAAFIAACREAMMRWTYTPMTFVEEVEGAKGNISESKRTAPFSMDYAFKFALVDGRPAVSAAE